MLNQIGVEPQRVLHIGVDFKTDFQVPQQLQMTAVLLKKRVLEYYGRNDTNPQVIRAKEVKNTVVVDFNTLFFKPFFEDADFFRYLENLTQQKGFAKSRQDYDSNKFYLS